MAIQSTTRSVIVIIGGGGMGLATARRLGSGRQVFLADFSDTVLSAAQETLMAEGHTVETSRVDISDFGSVSALARAAAAAGPIKAIVHTAGLSPAMAPARRIYEVDLLGTANVIDAFLPHVQRGTSLVCVASMAAYMEALSPELERHLATAPIDQLLHHPSIDLDNSSMQGRVIAYVIAKRGNIVRVQAAARAWGLKGSRLNSVSPGVISTSMGRQELEGDHGALIKERAEMSPVGRLGTPEDIANIVAFLTGAESSFITGNDYLIDGGVISTMRWNDEESFLPSSA
ncbi:short-chain dehydrogenase reductase sdr [Ilyonectria robusta]